jgi:hypothetical protein
MYFGTKNILKSNHNHTPKQIQDSGNLKSLIKNLALMYLWDGMSMSESLNSWWFLKVYLILYNDYF